MRMVLAIGLALAVLTAWLRATPVEADAPEQVILTNICVIEYLKTNGEMVLRTDQSEIPGRWHRGEITHLFFDGRPVPVNGFSYDTCD